MESRIAANRRRQSACSCCGRPLGLRQPARPFRLTDGMVLLGVSAVAFWALRPAFEGHYRLHLVWEQAVAIWVAVLVVWTPTLVVLQLRRPRPPVSRLMRQPGFVACVTVSLMIAVGVVAFGVLALDRAERFAELERSLQENPGWVPAPPHDEGIEYLAGPSGEPELEGVTVPLQTQPQSRGVPARVRVESIWTNPNWWLNLVLDLVDAVGPAVLGGWIVLGLSGRRRPSTGCFDLLGRGVGGSWVLLFLIYHVCRVVLWMREASAI